MYGVIRRSGCGTRWLIDTKPHIVIRLKALFPKIQRERAATLQITHSPVTATDLVWFLIRYPHELSPDDKSFLESEAAAHAAHVAALESIRLPSHTTTSYQLAHPLRQYQAVAADLFLASGRLLLADDIGLGKSAVGITALSRSECLPLLVVCQAHLPRQWQQEILKFVPTAKVHVLKKSKPYDLPDNLDAIVSTYHKLAGWADTLSRFVKCVVFDEIQELRIPRSQKYTAARQLGEMVKFKIGLSLSPNTLLLLRGGPFNYGWMGTIQDAYQTLRLRGVTPRLVNDYRLLDVAQYGITARSWSQSENGFVWAGVRTIIAHECTTQTKRIVVRGHRVTATDCHSLFRLNKGSIETAPTNMLCVGDQMPLDNGHRWIDGAPEETTVDIASIMPPNSKNTQVVVDISGFTRHDFGLTAWQWQNLQRERTRGSRLRLSVFLKYRHLLPEPTGMYFCSKGKARVVGNCIVKLSSLAYVLGFFLGDGWINNDSYGRTSSVSFSVDVAHEDKLVTELLRIRETPLNLEDKKRSRSCLELRCNNTFFANTVFDAFGGKHRCWKKEIPASWITTWQAPERLSLLDGLVDSDGSSNGNQRSYCTTSKRLAQSVCLLLTSLGFSPSWSSTKSKGGGIIDGRKINGKRRSYAVLWSINTGVHRGDALKYVPYPNWNVGVIKDSRSVKPSKMVYDLGMIEHPSFVVSPSGLLAHNSATPIGNYGGELFHVFQCIAPGVLGAHDEFTREWCHKFGDHWRLDDPDAFGSYLQSEHLMLRRRRSDVGRELPPVQRIVHQVEHRADVIEQIAGDAAELARLILEGTFIESGQAAREFDIMLRQVTGIAKAPYVAQFVRMLAEEGDKVLLAGWHRAVYDIWLDQLFDLNPVMYTGSESPTQKQASFDRFTTGDSRVMIISNRSGSGLNGLEQVCSVLVQGELDWSPAVMEQTIGRLNRDGMDTTKSVTAFYLLSDAGSDPAMARILGLKKIEAFKVLNPGEDLTKLGSLQVEGDRIKELARSYLKSHHGKVLV